MKKEQSKYYFIKRPYKNYNGKLCPVYLEKYTNILYWVEINDNERQVHHSWDINNLYQVDIKLIIK